MFLRAWAIEFLLKAWRKRYFADVIPAVKSDDQTLEPTGYLFMNTLYVLDDHKSCHHFIGSVRTKHFAFRYPNWT